MTFSYQKISQDLIGRLSEKAKSGESIVLLGPRYVGKRYVMHHLRRILESQGVTPILAFHLLSDTPISTTRDLEKIVNEAVRKVAPELHIEQPLAGGLGAIARLTEHVKKPVYLFAANVDSIAPHVARIFLQNVRTLVEDSPETKLVAIMSGENDFHELVFGPNSEFNCASQFVLQGHTEEEFDLCLKRYLTHMGLTLAEPAETSHYLWQLSGGNTFALRIILWSILQTRARGASPPGEPIPLREMPSESQVLKIPGAYVSHIFRGPSQIIKRHPKCWDNLMQLREGRELPLPPGQSTPELLELSGVAVRERKKDGRNYLKASSPLMVSFLQQYYDHRRVGDLYASVGDWERAFERYEQLEPEARKRPSGDEDSSDVDATVSALSASLYRSVKISKGFSQQAVDELKQLFADGCFYVLGFPEITFWQRDSWPAKVWVNRPLAGYAPELGILQKITELFPDTAVLPVGTLDVDNRFAAAAILPTIRQDEQGLVVVSDFGQEVVVSQERGQLLRKLIEHFVQAYKHAVAIDQQSIRLRMRTQHVRIMNTILKSLGDHDLSVRNVLALASSGLRNDLEYSVAVFSLVDPDRQWIESVPDNSAETLIESDGPIRFPLEPPMANVQSFVVSTRQSFTSDSTHPLAQTNGFIRSEHLKALSVIPLLNPAGDAIGTLLVERENGAMLSKEEIRDLEDFGRQLAIAIEQCERVNLLESGLDKVPEPLLIVDGTARPRYANQPAADLFGGSLGWRDRKHSDPLTDENAGSIAKLVRESLGHGYRLAGQVEGLVSKPYRGEVVADVIRDWRDKIVGGLIRVQDRDYLEKYFVASRRVAESNDRRSATRNMLEATRLLGHGWGRLYLVQPASDGKPDRFVSEFSFGFLNPASAESFDTGRVILCKEEGATTNDWRCVEEKRPIVFCWLDDIDDDEEYVTSHGLRAINWRNPDQPFEIQKSEGDFWIDFPLMTPRSIIGKICFQCDRTMRPENFELLKQLSDTYAGLLGAFLDREASLETREQTVRLAVAEKTMATLAHNLNNRIATLPIALAEYKRLEKDYPELAEPNDKFRHTLERSLRSIERARDLLAPEIRTFVKADIPTEIERTLTVALPLRAWQVESDQRPLEAEVDSDLFEMAILELVQNSRDAAPDLAQMFISVTVEAIHTNLTDVVTIVYRDNGPGVPDRIQHRIFEDFFSSRKGRHVGTGLGLGFVRRVIEAHDGNVFHNQKIIPGAGFVITIPRQQVSRDDRR